MNKKVVLSVAVLSLLLIGIVGVKAKQYYEWNEAIDTAVSYTISYRKGCGKNMAASFTEWCEALTHSTETTLKTAYEAGKAAGHDPEVTYERYVAALLDPKYH
jgi:hypothetical protein